MAVPEKERRLERRQRIRELSRKAREALLTCSRKSGVRLGALAKNENGAPLPFDGNYWSLTHKSAYVGAVIGPEPMGIDIERIRDISDGLIRKTASKAEWHLAGGEPDSVFFRYWTAKEAVLKATGVGIAGLSRCRVAEIRGDRHLRLVYAGNDYVVEHFFFDRHVASVVKNRFRVEWILQK
jgi:4'-phosphopantetheinyl transferase